MSQEIETRLKAIEKRLDKIEDSPLLDIAAMMERYSVSSLDDLFEESKAMLDAGPTLNSNLDLKIAEFTGSSKEDS